VIRPVEARDASAIRNVLRAAFGRDDEARLVERLRRDGDALVELVAERDGEILGHVLFSPAPVEREAGTVPCAALAPLAVLPSEQRRGIGGTLAQAGLAACARRGMAAVIVLGHPAY
jgi:putative acetyltransferase